MEATTDQSDNGLVFQGNMRVTGADHPDLVAQVSTHLARQGIEFDRMRCDSEAGPFGSCTLFEMDATLVSDSEVDVDRLRDDLVALENKLGIEIVLSNVRQVGHVHDDSLTA